MSDQTITVATNTVVTISDESENTSMNPWHVIGDLRAPGSGWSGEENYDVRDALQPLFQGVQFDPESSCFYAYCTTEAEAVLLVVGIQEWMIDHGRNGDYTPPADPRDERIAELEAENERLRALSRIGLKPPVPFGPEDFS